jgi:hypothetical protein
LGGQQLGVVQVVDDEVEAEDHAGEGLLLEGRQVGQIGQRDIGELGEQFLRLRVELEVADLFIQSELILEFNLIKQMITREGCEREFQSWT